MTMFKYSKFIPAVALLLTSTATFSMEGAPAGGAGAPKSDDADKGKIVVPYKPMTRAERLEMHKKKLEGIKDLAATNEGILEKRVVQWKGAHNSMMKNTQNQLTVLRKNIKEKMKLSAENYGIIMGELDKWIQSLNEYANNATEENVKKINENFNDLTDFLERRHEEMAESYDTYRGELKGFIEAFANQPMISEELKQVLMDEAKKLQEELGGTAVYGVQPDESKVEEKRPEGQ